MSNNYQICLLPAKNSFLSIILVALVMLYCCMSLVSCKKQDKMFFNVIDEWNRAINDRDYNALYSLYADKIEYYGKEMPKELCLNDKRNFFAKNPNYFQEINIDNITIQKTGEGSFKCLFTKNVLINGNIKKYTSYIFIQKVSDEYQVVSEGDEITYEETDTEEDGLAMSGDFDGDTNIETLYEVWLNNQKERVFSITNNIDDISEQIHTQLISSNPNIKPLDIKDAHLGLYNLINEGDLDHDGNDEISLLLGHETSVWHAFYLFKYENNSWKLLYSATVNTEIVDFDNVYQQGDYEGEINVFENEDWDRIRKKTISTIREVTSL